MTDQREGGQSRTYWPPPCQSIDKGKAKAEDRPVYQENISVCCCSASSSQSVCSFHSSPCKGKGRQTDPIDLPSRSSPVLTLPDLGDSFELHIKDPFLQSHPGHPSTSLQALGKEQSPCRFRSAQSDHLLFGRSNNKRAYKESFSFSQSSPSSGTPRISTSPSPLSETLSPINSHVRPRGDAEAWEQVRVSRSVICKKRRSNATSVASQDADISSTSQQAQPPLSSLSVSRQDPVPSMSRLGPREQQTPRLAQNSLHSFRQRSSLLSNSSTSDVVDKTLSQHALSHSSSSSSSSSDSQRENVDTPFQTNRRHTEHLPRRNWQSVAMRRHSELRAALASQAESSNPQHSASCTEDSAFDPNRVQRNSGFEARPLLLPFLFPSNRDRDASTSRLAPLDVLELDSVEADGRFLSPSTLEDWLCTDSAGEERSSSINSFMPEHQRAIGSRQPSQPNQGRSSLVELSGSRATQARTLANPSGDIEQRSAVRNDTDTASDDGTAPHATRPDSTRLFTAGFCENASHNDVAQHVNVVPVQSRSRAVSERAASGHFRPFESDLMGDAPQSRPARSIARSNDLFADGESLSSAPSRDTSSDSGPFSMTATEVGRSLQQRRERLASIRNSLNAVSHPPRNADSPSRPSGLRTDSIADEVEMPWRLRLSEGLLSHRERSNRSHDPADSQQVLDRSTADTDSLSGGVSSPTRPFRLGRDTDTASRDRPYRLRLSEDFAAPRERSRALFRPPTTAPQRSGTETALNNLRRLMNEDSLLDIQGSERSESSRLRMAARSEAGIRYPPYWGLHRPSTSLTPSDRIALDPRNFVADDDWSSFDTFEGLMRLADEIGLAETQVPPSLLETLPTCEYGKWDGGSCRLADRCPTPPDKGKGKQKVEVSQRDLMCPICREDYLDPDLLMSVPNCDHAFHADCLKTWFKNAKTCPLCRSDVLDRPRTVIKSAESFLAGRF